jgi:predicted nucleotidyltransferase
MLMNELQKDGLVEEFARRVRASLHEKVAAVIWFGSRVRGQWSEDSDYDLLVQTHEPISGEDRHAVSDISVDLSGRYRQLLDVHYADDRRMTPGMSLMSPFRAAVLQEGVRV